MKKWSEIKSEPITWGGCAKFYGWYIVIVLAIYAIAWVGVTVWYYYDDITEKIKNFTYKVKSKFKK